MKIRTKITLPIVLTTTAILLTATVCFYFYSAENLKTSIYHHLETTAQSRASHIEALLEMEKEAVQSLALIGKVEKLLLANENDPTYDEQKLNVNERLQKTVDSIEKITNIQIVDKSGITIAGTDSELLGSDRSTDPRFPKLNNGEIAVSDIGFSPKNGAPRISIASPVTVDDEIIGFVFMRADLEKYLFPILFDKTGLGETGETYLVNKEGYAISPLLFVEDAVLKQKVDTINSRNCFGASENPAETPRKHIGHEAVETFLDYRGEKVIGTHVYIPEMEWCLLAEINESEAMALIKGQLIFLMTSIIIILTILSVTTYLIVGYITKPITLLKKGTEIVGKGNLNYEVAVNSNDEIGDLSRSFDDMTQAIKQSRAEVDQKVEDQTKEIKESEERFRDVSFSSADWVWEVDASGKYTFVSGKIEEILGYTAKEVIGKTPFDFMSKDEGMRVGKIFQKIVSKKDKIVDLENWNISKNGKKILLLTSGVPILDNEGGLLGYRGVDRDITKKKEIEEDLLEKMEEIKREKNKINAVVQGIGDAVFVVDKDLKIVLFNPVASQMSGFSEKEALGKKYQNILKFVFESDRNKVNDFFIKNAIKTGKIQEMTNHTLLIGKQGNKVPVADSAAPLIDDEGQVIGCVVVFRNATKEREIDRMKTEFVSVASHQLKTPLTGIKWMSELLLREKLNDKQKEYALDVNSSAIRLTKLVDGLLNVSHIETGRKFDIEKEETNIIEIIDSAIKVVKENTEDKKTSIVKSKETPSKMMINVDPDKAKQAIGNLIDNAVRYSKQGGKVEISCLQDKDEVVLSVKDNGIGIPSKQQKKIFEKFFRADNAVQVETDGTGLGLYIVKAIIEAHDGKIWFKSDESEGTTFYVKLPIK